MPYGTFIVHDKDFQGRNRKSRHINAQSRKYQDAQYSIIGRVNLGARNAPFASRKCQDDFWGILGILAGSPPPSHRDVSLKTAAGAS